MDNPNINSSHLIVFLYLWIVLNLKMSSFIYVNINRRKWKDWNVITLLFDEQGRIKFQLWFECKFWMIDLENGGIILGIKLKYIKWCKSNYLQFFYNNNGLMLSNHCGQIHFVILKKNASLDPTRRKRRSTNILEKPPCL